MKPSPKQMEEEGGAGQAASPHPEPQAPASLSDPTKRGASPEPSQSQSQSQSLLPDTSEPPRMTTGPASLSLSTPLADASGTPETNIVVAVTDADADAEVDADAEIDEAAPAGPASEIPAKDELNTADAEVPPLAPSQASLDMLKVESPATSDQAGGSQIPSKQTTPAHDEIAVTTELPDPEELTPSSRKRKRSLTDLKDEDFKPDSPVPEVVINGAEADVDSPAKSAADDQPEPKRMKRRGRKPKRLAAELMAESVDATPGPVSPNDLAAPGDGDDAAEDAAAGGRRFGANLKPVKKLPGRRRARHPDDNQEARLRRQLQIKMGYRAVVKALKPLLLELGQRTTDTLENNPTAHQDMPEFGEITAELDRRYRERMSAIEARLDHETKRLKSKYEINCEIAKSSASHVVRNLQEEMLLKIMRAALTIEYEARARDENATDLEDGIIPPLHGERGAMPAVYDSRSRGDMETERIWHARLQRMYLDQQGDKFVLKNAPDFGTPADRRVPGGFALFDPARRQWAQAALNTHTLAEAAEAVESGQAAADQEAALAAEKARAAAVARPQSFDNADAVALMELAAVAAGGSPKPAGRAEVPETPKGATVSRTSASGSITKPSPASTKSAKSRTIKFINTSNVSPTSSSGTPKGESSGNGRGNSRGNRGAAKFVEVNGVKITQPKAESTTPKSQGNKIVDLLNKESEGPGFRPLAAKVGPPPPINTGPFQSPPPKNFTFLPTTSPATHARGDSTNGTRRPSTAGTDRAPSSFGRDAQPAVKEEEDPGMANRTFWQTLSQSSPDGSRDAQQSQRLGGPEAERRPEEFGPNIHAGSVSHASRHSTGTITARPPPSRPQTAHSPIEYHHTRNLSGHEGMPPSASPRRQSYSGHSHPPASGFSYPPYPPPRPGTSDHSRSTSLQSYPEDFFPRESDIPESFHVPHLPAFGKSRFPPFVPGQSQLPPSPYTQMGPPPPFHHSSGHPSPALQGPPPPPQQQQQQPLPPAQSPSHSQPTTPSHAPGQNPYFGPPPPAQQHPMGGGPPTYAGSPIQQQPPPHHPPQQQHPGYGQYGGPPVMAAGQMAGGYPPPPLHGPPPYAQQPPHPQHSPVQQSYPYDQQPLPQQQQHHHHHHHQSQEQQQQSSIVQGGRHPSLSGPRTSPPVTSSGAPVATPKEPKRGGKRMNAGVIGTDFRQYTGPRSR